MPIGNHDGMEIPRAPRAGGRGRSETPSDLEFWDAVTISGVLASLGQTVVYYGCMSRTNIDIDEAACQVVMQRYHLATKREAVNFALRALAGEPLSLDRARQLRGSGWEGDLDEMRSVRAQ